MVKIILSVGQCNADNSSLKRMLNGITECEIKLAQTFPETAAQAQETDIDLILVNRIFDANGKSGIEFIGECQNDSKLRDIPLMLVSNFADAQTAAETAGALPGFGKSELNSEGTSVRIRRALMIDS